MNKLDWINEYRDAGLNTLIALNGKIPVTSCWQKGLTEAEQNMHFVDNDRDIGIATGRANNLIVIDFDRLEKARTFYRDVAQSPWLVRTRRGVHVCCQCPEGETIGNRVGMEEGVDLRAEGGLVRVPPPGGGCFHQWVHPFPEVKHKHNELPVYDPAWFPQRPRTQGSPTEDAQRRIRRAVAWVAKADGAVSGHGGHNKTMAVAGALIQKFRLSVPEALPIMEMYNLRCQPPWSTNELLHKLESAVTYLHQAPRNTT